MTQCGKIESSQAGTDDIIQQCQKDARIQTHTVIIFLYYTFYMQPYYMHKESFIVKVCPHSH
jgi:hypothetical protein